MNKSKFSDVLNIAINLDNCKQNTIERGKILSKTLNLKIVENFSSEDTLLLYNKNRLELQTPLLFTDKKTTNFFVDFLKGSNIYRFNNNNIINQAIAKAVGIKSGIRPHIIDCTAGLGADSFVFASLGCKVSLIERSPLIAALLSDGMQRASADHKIGVIIKRMKLITGDSKEIISNIDISNQDTIYMDPMYPHKTKSALNKKEMRILRHLVGDDLDSTELLNNALKRNAKRVVVKRPKGANFIGNKKPSHSILMKNSRFDVYL